MFTNSSLRNFQESITRTSVIAVIVTILKMYIFQDKEATFDNTWLIVTLSKIAGFGLYDLFFYKFVDDSKFKINEKFAMKDILYFGGMAFIKDILVSYFQNTEFNPNFLKNFTLISVGFSIYHLYIRPGIFKNSDIKIDEVNKKNNSDMLKFTKKIFFGLFLIDIIPYFDDKEMLLSSILPNFFVLAVAFLVYFLVVRKSFSKILI